MKIETVPCETDAHQVVIDEIGRQVVVPAAVQRIVSLVPSLTEWLFAIGAGARVVGVTDYCLRPETGVAQKIKLRGTKNPDRAAIMALKPDLIIANKEENRERDVQALAAAGFAVYVTDPRTVRGAIDTLERLANLVGAINGARHLLDAMRTAIERPVARKSSPRVLAAIWRDPWMAIGADTYADDLLRECGAINVAAELGGRYPRFDLEAVAQLAPDVILLPSEPYAFSQKDVPALRLVFRGPIRFVDGELLTWYGPRLVQALHTFRAVFGDPVEQT